MPRRPPPEIALPRTLASLDRLRDAGVCAAVALAPFETEALALPIAGVRLTLLELAIGLAGGAALLDRLRTLSASGKAPRLGRLGAALLGLAMVVAASAALAPGPAEIARVAWLGGARSLGLLGFVLAVADAWRGPARRPLLLSATAATAVFLLLGAFEQLAGDGLLGVGAVEREAALLEPFRIKASVTSEGTRRLTASFAHANLAAAYLAATLAFAVGAAPGRRLLGRAFSLAVAVCLALTLSRGGLFAGGLACAVLLLWPTAGDEATRERRLRVGLAGLGVLLSVATAPGLRARLLGASSGVVAATLSRTAEASVRAENTGRTCWRPAGRDRHRLVAFGSDGEELAAVDAPTRLCPGATFAIAPPAGTDHVRFEHHGLRAFASMPLDAREGDGHDVAAEVAPISARPAGRAALWRDALRLGAERPLLGWGPDTFRLRKGGDAREHANNIALEAFADTGALGVVALFVALLAGVLGAWRRREQEGAGERGVAVAVVVAYAGHGLLDCVLFFYGPTVPLCVAVGVLLASEPGTSAGDDAGS
ncbi:MAG: O-antigen ligase family protein [Deltaproteobacteria bacterium]|nr:O-antigen ligase family protein [Deltaproteobacteria bacterium]